MEKVADKALDLLQALAVRLGTTVEQLWPYMVRQFMIAGVTNLLVWGTLGLVALVCGYQANRVRVVERTKRFSREPNSGSWRDREPAGYETTMIAFSILLPVAGIVLLAGALATNIPAILNPEFYAIRAVLRLVK